MKITTLAAVLCSSLILFGTRSDLLQKEENFVGGTPAGGYVRKFLKIPFDKELELIRWQLSLQPDHSFKLACSFGVIQPNTMNFKGGGEQVSITGKWTTEKGIKNNPASIVYTLESDQGASIRMVKMDDRVFHLLFSDKSLLIGNGGWSYTLNKSRP